MILKHFRVLAYFYPASNNPCSASLSSHVDIFMFLENNKKYFCSSKSTIYIWSEFSLFIETFGNMCEKCTSDVPTFKRN